MDFTPQHISSSFFFLFSSCHKSVPLCMCSPHATVICSCMGGICTWTMWIAEMGQDGGRSSCWGDPLRSGFLLRPARHCLQPCIRTVRCASEHPLERPIHAYMSPRVQCRLKCAGWLYRRNTGGWRAVSSYAYLFPILIPLRSTFYLRLVFHFSFRASGFSFSL